jgi:hypothetical protein
MIPELSSEPQAATADLIVALALGRIRHRGRPWARPVRSLLAIASVQLPRQVSPGAIIVAPAPTMLPS